MLPRPKMTRHNRPHVRGPPRASPQSFSFPLLLKTPTNADASKHCFVSSSLMTTSSEQSFTVCFCFSRKFKLTAAEPPPEIKSLFDQYAAPSGVMTSDSLLKFMIEIQGEVDATKEHAHAIVDHHHRRRHIITRTKGLNFDSFFRYLFGDQNAPLLQNVFNLRHNSYLTGNQISSICSDVPIIEALENGVRTIELDLWPNSAKDDIHVLHGRTLTTPVGLTKCLKSIKENAFITSELPVILTFEDHLTPKLQAKVAELVVEIFGDILYTCDTKSLEKFPSPETLKRRIIISTKPPKEYLQSSSGNTGKGKDESSLMKGNKVSSDDDEDAEDEVTYQDEGCTTIQQSVALAYKNLIAIHARARKGGLKEWIKLEADKVRRLSMREQVLEKAVLTHGKEIIRFTQDNLLRIFPKGSRLDSSNYNPMVGWMHGAQMVAFNMQVKVYMGEGWYTEFPHTHFDTYSPPDFYTRVGISGVPGDCAMKKTTIKQDEWSPVWDEEFEFKLTVPELALLRVEVHEYDVSGTDDFGGQTCLPVSELCTGIRAVPLHNRKGHKYKCVKLLMRYTFV
ncbi:hypothetical protein QQ045_022837 [Rhodiola kirilowii]